MVKLHPTHIANVTREPLMYLYMGHKAKPKRIDPAWYGAREFQDFSNPVNKEYAI